MNRSTHVNVPTRKFFLRRMLLSLVISAGLVLALLLVAAPAWGSEKAHGAAPPIEGVHAPGIIVETGGGLLTSEDGRTDTFTVTLASQPTKDVEIGLSSSDPGEGVPDKFLLTFTKNNWDTPQVVTVSGVDDALQDGPQSYTIITAPAVSDDPAYSGINASDVSASNLDNDLASVYVNPTNGLETGEDGSTDTFWVVLTTLPSAPVTITLSSSDGSEGTAAPAQVVFKPADWDTPVMVTVTGLDDDFDDGDQPYTIVTAAAASDDPDYDGYNPADVQATNIDNDSASISVAPASGLTTSEAGGTAVFSLTLTSRPTASVVIGLSSSNPAEGMVDPAQVTILPADWDVSVPVTVTGVDDDVDDDDKAYSIITSPASSSDPKYNNYNPLDVSVTNQDDDQAGIIVEPSSGLVTSEAGAQDTFNIRLNSRPTASVTIGLSSSDLAEGTVSQASVTILANQWDTNHTVTVTGVDDLVDDGDQAYSIVTAPADSTDGKYNNRDAVNVSVTNTDNDGAQVLYQPASGLVTSEYQQQDWITITLGTRPKANVTIQVKSSDPGEGVPSPASLTFTTSNWNLPQTVAVTGVADGIDDGDQAYEIELDATSSDQVYDKLGPYSISAINKDKDSRVFLPLANRKYADPVLYFDSLDADRGWQLVPESGASAYFANSYYYLKHTIPERNVRTVAPPSSDLIPPSYAVEVDASLAPGGDTGSQYGITFDWLDETRFYRFLVSPAEDKFFLYKFAGGWQLLAQGSAALNNGLNHLKVERNLDLIRVYANDMALPLAEIYDAAYLNGRVGLTILSSPSTSALLPALVYFNNFSISTLPYAFKATFTAPSTTAGWYLAPETSAEAFVTGGTLHLKHVVANRNVRLISPPLNPEIPLRYAVTVQAQVASGADADTRYGILFDWLDELRTYRLLASPVEDKIYLQKFTLSGWTAVGAGEYAVNLSTGLNTLRIERDGSKIRIYANNLDAPVVEVSDSTYTGGRAGVIIVAPDPLSGYAEASFDNFVIKALD